jgi:hypothetical protein
LKKLRLKAPAALDNPTRWNQRLKPWFDVERYQDRINERVGLNRDGRPIVRLVWGQEVWQVVFGESTPRYWTRRLRAGSNFVWWTVPRWIFERRIEPEQYTAAWNATRYSLKDPTEGIGHRCDDCGSSSEPEILNGKLYCRSCAGSSISGGAVIDKGPPPSEMYTWMMEAAEHEGMTDPVSHWPLCCTRQFYTDRRRCWGTYRAPSDFDLLVLEQTTRAMNADKFRDPYAPLTAAQLAETELAANLQVERAAEQFEEYEQQLWLEVQRAYPVPGSELTGYSDLGPAFAKGTDRGIILTDS